MFIEWTPVEMSPVLLFVLAGAVAVLGLLLLSRHLSARRLQDQLIHCENELHQAHIDRQRFAAIVNQAAEAVLITDAQARIVFVNPAFTALLGYGSRDVIGQTPKIFRTDRHEDAFYRAIRDALAQKHVWRGLFTNRCKDGRLLELDTVISSVFDEHGKLSNYVSAARDMTHERQLEKQLHQSQKMEALGTLAGGIAHDFNNILSAIIGFAELGMLEPGLEPSVQESLQQVLKAARRAADLVSRILTFSRRAASERQPIMIGPIVDECLTLLRGSIPASIEIHKQVDEHLPPVMTDPTQIHQLLMNLCTNASYAMRENGGALTVALHPVLIAQKRASWQSGLATGNYVEIKVADTGQGMAPETMARIFDPYFTTKRGGEGTGLGLATVHGIVMLHEGAIHVESKPGEGTTFTILLPVCHPDTVVPDLPAEKRELHRGHDEHILVVDDEESIAKMLEATLDWLGYQVEAFTSSVKALERFRQDPHRFAAVITDQTMPTLVGSELARRLLEIRPDLPIILCSGYTETVNAEIAASIGIRKFIMKPIAGKALAVILQSLLHPDHHATA